MKAYRPVGAYGQNSFNRDTTGHLYQDSRNSQKSDPYTAPPLTLLQSLKFVSAEMPEMSAMLTTGGKKTKTVSTISTIIVILPKRKRGTVSNFSEAKHIKTIRLPLLQYNYCLLQPLKEKLKRAPHYPSSGECSLVWQRNTLH